MYISFLWEGIVHHISIHGNDNIYRVLLHSTVHFMATILCVSYFYGKVKSIIYRSIKMYAFPLCLNCFLQ